ncbi:MAG TPA: PAS domain S-box protein, partial [Opitutaceae bacterium]
DTPFIFCSGTIGEDRAIEAMRSGATDYVLKENLNRLVPSIERALAESADRRGRREAEGALRRSERRYRALINAIAQIVWSTGPHGENPTANPSWSEFTGTPTEADPLGWLSTLHPDDREKVRAAWTESLSTLRPYDVEFRVKRADGEWRYMHARAVPQIRDDNTIEEWVGICFDITERKNDQRKLREQAEVITQARDAVVIADLEGRITFWNRGAERLYGWTAAEAIGRKGDELFDERTIEATRTPLKEIMVRGSWNGELVMRNRELRPLFVDVSISLVYDDTGKPKARLSIATDITEKKNLEEQFLRAQRMDNLGLLAAGISHDLNNILAPILMIGPLLRSRLFDSSDHKLVDTLEQSAQRGADMVHQILSFARGASGELGLIQIRHLLKDILQIIESTFPKNVVVRHNIDSHLSAVRANPTQIHQLLLNLCVNARDAMPEGGTLTINAEDRTIPQISHDGEHNTRAGNYVVIEVADTGTGIAPEVFARMWEPFYTTKGGKGTGLGLSTVRGIIETHQGFIEAQTELGRGTTFRVYLPALKGLENHHNTATPFEAPHGQNETVLIVDDEEHLREMIGTTLSSYDYKTIVAQSPADAIEQASINRDRIRVLITDVSMPIINGNALASIVRRLVPGIKVLVISGHTNTEPFGDLFLAKPFKSDALLEALDQLLHR